MCESRSKRKNWKLKTKGVSSLVFSHAVVVLVSSESRNVASGGRKIVLLADEIETFIIGHYKKKFQC